MNLGNFNSPVNGGWYTNPQTGQNMQWLNGQWQTGGNNQQSNPLSAYQNTTNEMNSSLQNYINQQQGFYNTSNQLEQNLLNAGNTQALGTQDQNAQQSFLNSVLTPDQKQQGSLEYGYNLGQNNENAMYGINSTNNQQNRDLALAKLSNDENFANQNLNLQQGNQNASTIDSLNSRGLLYGQAPTGAYQGQAMGNMNGVANEQAQRVNTDFGNQRGQLQTDYGLNVRGANQSYNQQQNALNQSHTYNSQENAFNAANGINQQNNQYTYQTGENANQLQMYKAQLAQQQAQSQFQNKLSAQKLQGSNYG